MKLYTEEQVKRMLFDLGDVLFNNNQNGIEEGEPAIHFDGIINEQTPIELPSDEEISEESMDVFWGDSNSLNHILQYKAFKRGAKWMRDKIQKFSDDKQ
jgi:hypothetical protein